MKPIEAERILNPADDYTAHDEAQFLQARSIGAAAISKMRPNFVVGGRCPRCRSRVYREYSFCPKCGQMLGWKS